MLNTLTKKYTEYILNPNPTKAWKVTRFFLHWITLPLKLITIGGLGCAQIILKLFVKNRAVPAMPTLETKQAYLKKVMDNLPLVKTNYIELYANRVPFFNVADGTNHNTDHQCSRHGTYTFLMEKLGLRNDKQDAAASMHMHGQWLSRGYKQNPYDGQIQYNTSTTSGDMLCGLNLAMVNTRSVALRDNYELMLAPMIEDNDWSLLEGGCPEKGDPGYDFYINEMKTKYGENIRLKSARGMWQPGLECAGAQALTLLAALRIGDKKLKMPAATKAYKKMLWMYGYGLLALFPTAYIDKQRGYFNDHNCLIALHTLSKLADSKVSRLFWKIPMVYVWLLSRHWYNGYFTGLVNDAHPGTISQNYVNKCQAYLYEKEPLLFTMSPNFGLPMPSEACPLNINSIAYDEFSPDTEQNLLSYVPGDSPNKVKTGLGFMSAAIMLEKDPKDLLK
jgi:hypothetical protein